MPVPQAMFRSTQTKHSKSHAAQKSATNRIMRSGPQVYTTTESCGTGLAAAYAVRAAPTCPRKPDEPSSVLITTGAPTFANSRALVVANRASTAGGTPSSSVSAKRSRDCAPQNAIVCFLFSASALANQSRGGSPTPPATSQAIGLSAAMGKGWPSGPITLIAAPARKDASQRVAVPTTRYMTSTSTWSAPRESSATLNARRSNGDCRSFHHESCEVDQGSSFARYASEPVSAGQRCTNCPGCASSK